MRNIILNLNDQTKCKHNKITIQLIVLSVMHSSLGSLAVSLILEYVTSNTDDITKEDVKNILESSSSEGLELTEIG